MSELTKSEYIKQHPLPEMHSYEDFINTPGSVGEMQKLAGVDEDFIMKLYESIISGDYRHYLSQLKK